MEYKKQRHPLFGLISINISDVKYVDNSLAIEAVMNCYPM